jgi:hypothetical protein
VIESVNFDKGAIESLLDNNDSSDKISRFDDLSISSVHTYFVLHVHQVDQSNYFFLCTVIYVELNQIYQLNYSLIDFSSKPS